MAYLELHRVNLALKEALLAACRATPPPGTSLPPANTSPMRRAPASVVPLEQPAVRVRDLEPRRPSKPWARLFFMFPLFVWRAGDPIGYMVQHLIKISGNDEW